MSDIRAAQPPFSVSPNSPDNNTSSTDSNTCSSNNKSATERDHRYEVMPQRSGPRFRVRYREGSLPAGECRLCQS